MPLQYSLLCGEDFSISAEVQYQRKPEIKTLPKTILCPVIHFSGQQKGGAHVNCSLSFYFGQGKVASFSSMKDSFKNNSVIT